MDEKNHLTAATVFCDLIRSTLGPRGMNKMVVSDRTILSNDGATIVNSIKGGDPIVELFKNLAKSQEEIIGDGTTTSVVLAGQLISNAQILMNKGLHPTTIIKGYNLARIESMNVLNRLREKGEIDKIIKTAFGTKLAPDLIELLTKLFLKVKNFENLKIFKETGDSTQTNLFNGLIFRGRTINDRMKNKVEGKIAVLDFPTNWEADIKVDKAEELKNLQNMNKEHRKNIINELVKNGVDCVFYTDTNPELESYMTDKLMGIVIFQREHIDNICNVTGARACSNIEEISDKLGYGEVRYEKFDKIYVSNDSSFKTLHLKAPTSQILDEIERAVHDIISLLKNETDAVIGAGAIEMEIAKSLYEFAKKVGGKEQLAIEKYAESIESIPQIIAENCGLDAVDILTKLKACHAAGEKDVGVDELRGISDARKRGVIEPVLVKIHAFSSATNITNMILKLDKILVGEEAK